MCINLCVPCFLFLRGWTHVHSVVLYCNTPIVKWRTAIFFFFFFCTTDGTFSSALILRLFIRVSRKQESRIHHHLCSVITLRNRFSMTDSSNRLQKVTALQPHPLHPIYTPFCCRQSWRQEITGMILKQRGGKWWTFEQFFNKFLMIWLSKLASGCCRTFNPLTHTPGCLQVIGTFWLHEYLTKPDIWKA